MMRPILLLFVVFCGVHSALFFEDQPVIPGHEGECLDEETKMFFSQGTIIRNQGPECKEVTCSEYIPETKTMRITTATCGVLNVGPGFLILQKPNKPYPECCPMAVPDPNYIKPCEPNEKNEKSD